MLQSIHCSRRFGSGEPRFCQKDADHSFLPERSLLEQGMQASNKAFSTTDWNGLHRAAVCLAQAALDCMHVTSL